MFEPRGFADIAAELARLRQAAGNPSYTTIVGLIGEVRARRGVPAERQRPPRITVYDCFKPDRKRVDVGLVVDIAVALGLSSAEVADFEAACWAVQHRVDAARIVAVRDELPDPPRRFVGRRAELDRIVGSRQPVRVIHGLAGSGKTELACAAARQLLAAGDAATAVFVELRGFAADRPPADPHAAVDAIVRVLGGDSYRLPRDPAERHRAYSDLLAERRALLVLDDAAAADQVDPLLPDDDAVAVLVTSRRVLAAELGAADVLCDVLDDAAAVELLASAATIADDDTDTVLELARGVGCLPLALDVVASRLVDKPDWSLADHAASLVDWHGEVRLDDAVERVLDETHRALNPAAANALRLLASQPFPSFGRDAVAAVVGSDELTVDALIAELAATSMVTQPSLGRIAFHDLVRAHARARSLDADRPSARETALDRVLEHFAVMTRAAAEANTTRRIDPPRHPLRTTPPQLDAVDAATWLDANFENLLIASAPDCAAVRPTIAIELAENVAWFVERRSLHLQAFVVADRALEAARRLGDDFGEGLIEIIRAQWLVRTGEVSSALAALRRAEVLVAGDRHALARVHTALAVCAFHSNDWDAALEHMLTAVDLTGDDALPGDLAVQESNIAVVYSRIGDQQRAIEYLQRSAEHASAAADPQAAAFAWMNLSGAQARAENYTEALAAADRALALSEQHDIISVLPLARNNAASALFELGRRAEGIACGRQALVEGQGANDRNSVVDVRANLAGMLIAEGRFDEAAAELAAAEPIAAELGDRFHLGRLRAAAGRLSAGRGDLAAARQHWIAALAAFDDSVPEAAKVEAELAALDAAADVEPAE